MPDSGEILVISGLLPESITNVDHFRRSQELRHGGILILRAASRRSDITEAVFVADRWPDMRKLLAG